MTEWNGFKGRAKRIEDVDLPRVGHEIGVGEDVVHAIMDVESRGYGFDKRGRPIILFERHVFYRCLQKHAPGKLAAAKAAGLAVKGWSRATYSQDQYALLARAMEIDETCALMAPSWGLGQVLGENYAMCGYETPQAFVRAMMDDEDNHLEAMIAFIKSAGLAKACRELEAAKTWEQMVAAGRKIARGYNGTQYAKNNYHIRIAQAFRKWRGIKDTPWSPDDAVAEDRTAGITVRDMPNAEIPVPAEKPTDTLDADLADALAETFEKGEPATEDPQKAVKPTQGKPGGKNGAAIGVGAGTGAGIIVLLINYRDLVTDAATRVLDRITAIFDSIGGMF